MDVELEHKKQSFDYMKLLFGVAIIATLLLPILVIMPSINFAKRENMDLEEPGFLVGVAKAEEIYPEFVCGCCGKPLDPENICCGMMKEMIEYVNKQVTLKQTKEQTMINMVKEFGFDLLARDETRKELKEELAKNAPDDAPRINFEDPENADLGTISQKNGIVTKIFDFKNDGNSELIISKISTSCGCTSASIVYNGAEGPTFTMPGHGKENPKDWSVSIAPGYKGQLKVYYDPNAHGKQSDKEMAITRTIDIFSNDPVEFEKRIKIELIQTP